MIFCIVLVCFVAVHGSGMNEERHPQPYSFGYTIKDHEGVQHRQETGNGAGVVQGNYGFVDNKGIRRQVDYVADQGGFRAQIKTNEPGTAGQSPAHVTMMSEDSYAHGPAAPFVSRMNDHAISGVYESDDVYGYPTRYDHRTYSQEQDAPSGGYKFITPMTENRYSMTARMPAHPHNPHMPAQVSVYNRVNHMPAHFPVHNHIAPHQSSAHMPPRPRDHLMTAHIPVHHRDNLMNDRLPVHQSYHHMTPHAPVHPRDQHMNAVIPVYDHVVPRHVPDRMPFHHKQNPLNTYEQGYSHMYGPRYMSGGFSQSSHSGAGHRV